MDTEEREFVAELLRGDARFAAGQARLLKRAGAEPERVARCEWIAAALGKAAERIEQEDAEAAEERPGK